MFDSLNVWRCIKINSKKSEILKAAGVCFSRYGYEKTTLDDIGKLVGLNKASLYYYFKSKEDICAEVIFKEADEFKSGIIKEVGNSFGYQEKIITYLVGRLNFIKGASYLSQLSNDSLERIAPLFNNMYNRLLQEEIGTLSAILESGIKNGEIGFCDTNRIAKSILMVSEAIRSKIDCCLATEEAYQEAISEIQFTISLILNGLPRNETTI